MSSKREINEWADRAINHLSYALADLKRLRREPMSRAPDIHHDMVVQLSHAHEFTHRIFKALHPDLFRDPEPVDNGGDRHIRIRRARLLPAPAPAQQPVQAQLEDDPDQLLLPGVKR